MVIIYIVLDMHPFGISKTVSGLSFDSPFFMPRSPTNTTKRSVSKPFGGSTDRSCCLFTCTKHNASLKSTFLVRQLKPDTVQVKPILRKVYPKGCEA